MLLFGLIGFVDDYIKIKKRRSLGLTARQKFLAEACFAVILGYYLITYIYII